MKPPFRSEGTTATHSAEPSTSSGMRWSGAAWISSSTEPAASTRPVALELGSPASVSGLASWAERVVAWKQVSKQNNNGRTRKYRINLTDRKSTHLDAGRQ